MQFTIEPDFPPHPQCYRSVCEACGVGTRKGVRVLAVSNVNIDHEDGFYTGLFLCELCVTEWSRAFGMLVPIEAEEFQETIAALEAHVAALRADVAALQGVRNAVHRIIAIDDLEAPDWLDTVDVDTEDLVSR